MVSIFSKFCFSDASLCGWVFSLIGSINLSIFEVRIKRINWNVYPPIPYWQEEDKERGKEDAKQVGGIHSSSFLFKRSGEKQNQIDQKETGDVIFVPPIPSIAVHKETTQRAEAPGKGFWAEYSGDVMFSTFRIMTLVFNPA